MMNLAPLIGRLKLSEGYKSKFYFDTTGNITIGYGFNLGNLILPKGVSWRDVKLAPVNGITPSIAEALLIMVLVDSAEALKKAQPWVESLDTIRQQVLFDMAYNLGTPGLLQWPIFLGQVQRGEYKAAARNMLGTPWARQVGNRAVRLAHMMEHGEEPE